MIAFAFDWSSLPSFLAYGIPGLALGLVVAALMGIAAVQVNADRLKALEVVLKYGTGLVGIAVVAVTIPLFVAPKVAIHVTVDPASILQDPNARAVITSDLSPDPNSGLVIVEQANGHDYIHVDVRRLVRQVNLARTEASVLQDQNSKLSSALDRSKELLTGTMDNLDSARKAAKLPPLERNTQYIASLEVPPIEMRPAELPTPTNADPSKASASNGDPATAPNPNDYRNEAPKSARPPGH